MKKQLYRILPALLAVGALSLPLAADSVNAGAAVGSAGSGAVGAAGSATGGSVNAAGSADVNGKTMSDSTSSRPSTSMHITNAMRSDYKAFSSRLDKLAKRIDEKVHDNVYTAEEAARHRADLAALRDRFKTAAGHLRHLSAAARHRLDSDIADQEIKINADNSGSASSSDNTNGTSSSDSANGSASSDNSSGTSNQ